MKEARLTTPQKFNQMLDKLPEHFDIPKVRFLCLYVIHDLLALPVATVTKKKEKKKKRFTISAC
jgi:hypothetical protein